MSHPVRSGLAAVNDFCERQPYLLPLAILVVGGIFRFYNLNWDNGHQLHPDERGIFLLLTGSNNAGHPLGWPSSISQFFDTRPGIGSPLDPHYFAYGSLPYYLLALVAGTISVLGQHLSFLSQWSQLDSYGGYPLLARGLSALLDLISVGLVFLIARRIYGYWTAVLAMALTAFTVLDIQLAHFYQTDSLLIPLALLVVLAAVVIIQTNSRAAYLWGGVALGAALASKTTGLLLVIPLGVSALLAGWNAHTGADAAGSKGLVDHYRVVADKLNSNVLWLLGTYLVALATFAICEPYGILDHQSLVNDVVQQSNLLVSNNPPYGAPYTIQYAHTIPYVYQIANLLFWGMGIPLGLTAFAGVLLGLVRNVGIRMNPPEVVLLVWVIPYFLFVGRFFAKFDRYMLPIVPVMIILGAALLIRLVRKGRGPRRLLGWTALGAVVVVSFLYSLAYMNIYEHPNTRVVASRWMYSHIPQGTTIAVEAPWDDTLPLDEQGHSAAAYFPKVINLDLYNVDDQRKIANITDALQHSSYIVMSSERLIGSIPKLPDRYPLTIRYYNLLMDGKLNFRLEKVFQQHPQLGPIVVHDYPADESFHVYDHPIVRIFKRVSPISSARVAALLNVPSVPGSAAAAKGTVPAPNAVPDRRLMLSSSQWKADQRGQTMDQMFPPTGFAMKHPILVWLFFLELIGLLTFPLTFLVLSNLVDRGFVIAKTFGLLILGYFVWMSVRVGPATFDRGLIAGVLLVFAALSLLLAYRLRSDLLAFFRLEWRRVLAGELVFLTGFALFILLRMWYPDLGHQFSPVSASNIGDGRMGEKQMELAFLNAIVRSRVFPPYDPFFAHGYINYYYYGFFLVGMLCKLMEIAPATGFNLAIATFFAMLVANVFSVGLNLTRRVVPGVLAAVFVALLGNLNGGWQVIRGLISVATLHSSVPLIGGVLDVVSGLRETLSGHQTLPPFDYWEPTRILPPVGGPITEFPYFTYLFADLHPHLIAYPMTVGVLALAVNLALGSYRSLLSGVSGVLFGGVLVGALAVTNPWDFPTYLLVVGLGAFVGAYVIRRKLGWQELLRPAAWVGSLAALSFLLYLPFKRDYQTVFTSGIGLVRDITPATLRADSLPSAQMHDALVTPLTMYLEHFGLFVFAIVSFLTLLLLVDAGGGYRIRRLSLLLRLAAHHRGRLPQLWKASKAVRRISGQQGRVVDGSILSGFAVVVVGLTILQYFLLAFLVAFLGLLLLLLLRLRMSLSGAQLFVLALIVVPIALSIVTQVVFVKDWLAGGKNFRMNTIFKFYNQAWVIYAIAAAVSLYYFIGRQIGGYGRWQGDDDAMEWNPVTSDASAERWSRSVDLKMASEARSGTKLTRQRRIPSLAFASMRGPFGAFDGGRELGPAASNTHATSSLAEPAIPVSSAEKSKPRWAPSRWFKGAHHVSVILERRPFWSLCLILLVLGSLVYTYAGTVSRETYREAWLPEKSVPFTLDGMAFMKVAYPQDYAGINWLNAHVRGAQVVAEADDGYYDWRSRVSMFTGLPSIVNGNHEGEQRYGDELTNRGQNVKTLYSSTDPTQVWKIINSYGVRYIFVGFSERQCATSPTKVQCFPRAGLAKFDSMVGHGLRVAFRKPGITIYAVTRP